MVRPALSVVAGLTYRDGSQVFNRWLLPTYQVAFRWTGNGPDAEDATTWVLIQEMRSLKFPELVQVVDEMLAETTLDAVGRHWSERYGVSPLRHASIRATEAALLGQPRLSFDALTDCLPADQHLVIVLRFLRGRTLSSIATQLGVAARASATLLYRALSEVAARLGFHADPTDLAQVDRVAAFVGDLVARRRPLRFEAAQGAWAAMVAATHVQASIAGNDLPRVPFVRSLEELAGGCGLTSL